MTTTYKIRLQSLKKEATLLFLAVFYFLIATNTQTGWLFVLSAFLLGVLVISWVLSRRSIHGLDIVAKIHGEAQRGKALRVEILLSNGSPKPVHEPRVEMERPEWARSTPDFQWAIPKMPPESSARTSYSVVPVVRGEHALPPLRIICGAPFGLFTVVKSVTMESTLLIYPEIEKLPQLKSRSRAATALGELTSPTGRGDTHSLRSVREYRPGDDLRQVHWKASARLGPGSPLLVREHHAPAPNRVLLFLDTSGEGAEKGIHQPFERAVALAASVLWSATRDGTQAGLALRDDDGQWSVLCHWPQQYRALARVQLHPSLSPEKWSEEAAVVFRTSLPRGFQTSQATVVKGAVEAQTVDSLPSWINKLFLLQDPTHSISVPNSPKVVRLDSTRHGFYDV